MLYGLSDGIQLPNDEFIKNIEEGEGFKNLEKNVKVRKEYFCRITKILKSKLHSGNVVTTINSRAVSCDTLVLIARFRAGLAGLNLGYPENLVLKPRKPSS